LDHATTRLALRVRVDLDVADATAVGVDDDAADHAALDDAEIELRVFSGGQRPALRTALATVRARDDLVVARPEPRDLVTAIGPAAIVAITGRLLRRRRDIRAADRLAARGAHRAMEARTGRHRPHEAELILVGDHDRR